MDDDRNENKSNDRYFTNQKEYQILSKSIGTYNMLPKRSQDRKSFIAKVQKELEKINPGQWDDKKVRVWFTNNEKRFRTDGTNEEPGSDNQYRYDQPQQLIQQPQYEPRSPPPNQKPRFDHQNPLIKPQIRPHPQQQNQQNCVQQFPIQQQMQIQCEPQPQILIKYEPQPIIQQQQIHPQQPPNQPQYEPQPLIQQQFDHREPPNQPKYEPQPIIQQPPNQPKYEQQPIIQQPPNQPQYEQQPVIQQPPNQPQYEQQPIIQKPPNQPQYEQQPIIQKPLNQPQYEQQLIVQQTQYDHQQPLNQPQYEQQPIIQQTQYDHQQPPNQPQYEQQPIIHQTQYDHQQPPNQPQYEQQQHPIQQTQYEPQQTLIQQQLQYQTQASETCREQSEMQFIPNFPGSDIQSQSSYPFNVLSVQASSAANSVWQGNTYSLASNAVGELKNAETEPGEPEEDISDDLPSVPEVGENLSEHQKDDLKFKLYHILGDCYRYFKQIKNYKNSEKRLSKQKELETVFIKILNMFSEKLGIKEIVSKDSSSLCITSKNISTVSITTQRYNNFPEDTDAPKNGPPLIEGDPFIYYSNTIIPTRLSPLMKSFYFGKYEEGCREVINISNIEAATFIEDSGESICTVFDQFTSSHKIIWGQNAEAPTGFFGKASSMIVHDNNVFIQGDVRVKVFNLNSLECIDTLFIKDEEITKSAISIWNDNIAVGVDNTIYIYSLNKPMSCKEDPIFKKKYEGVSIQMKIDKNSIEWTRGRTCKRAFKVDNIKSISSIITVNKTNLVVASEDYPVIYVYGKDEGMIARLIGHTMGITSLYTSDVNSFYSGSKDKTVKKWNINDAISTHSFIMHGSDVTSIATANYNNHLFLFSGSRDSRILVWDVTAKKSTFQIDVTEKLYPTELLFIPNWSTLYIIAQNKDKQGQQINSEDQVQIFTFSK